MLFASQQYSPVIRAFALAAALVGVAGCSSVLNSSARQSADGGRAGSGPTTQIAGIALPEGYSLNSDRTIVLGEGDRWIGRLSYSVNSTADAMFDFVRREMANYGWTEVAVVRAETSQLTFLSAAGDRVASVLIVRSTLYGSRVDMTVAPSTGAAVSARAAGAARK